MKTPPKLTRVDREEKKKTYLRKGAMFTIWSHPLVHAAQCLVRDDYD